MLGIERLECQFGETDELSALIRRGCKVSQPGLQVLLFVCGGGLLNQANANNAPPFQVGLSILAGMIGCRGSATELLGTAADSQGPGRG